MLTVALRLRLLFCAVAAALCAVFLTPYYYSLNIPKVTTVSDDMSGFKSVAYFVNWVGLSPETVAQMAILLSNILGHLWTQPQPPRPPGRQIDSYPLLVCQCASREWRSVRIIN